MTAPKPAAIADAMNYAAFLRGLDSLSWEQRTISDLSLEVIRMRDHIRAIAEEMRAEASRQDYMDPGTPVLVLLNRFADKLEGKQ